LKRLAPIEAGSLAMKRVATNAALAEIEEIENDVEQ
jgi:hypothetical protein